MYGPAYSIRQNLLLPLTSRPVRRGLCEYIGAQARASGQSPLRVYLRLFGLCARALADYEDCRTLGLYSKIKEEQLYLTAGRYGRLIRLINDKKASFPRDRKTLYTRFEPFLKRQWRLISPDTPLDEIKDWARRHPVFLAQSPGQKDGREPERVSAGFFEDEFDLKGYLVRRGLFLLEEFILSHEDIAALSPGAQHSVLITTFLTGERTHIFGAALRAGLSGSSGRLICPVDAETGTVCGPGRLAAEPFVSYEKHPDTGLALSGLCIPYYDRLIELCAVLAAEFASLPFLSFEFAIGERSLMLLDANALPDHRIHQAAQGRGLYPEFTALAREYVRQAEARKG